MSDVLRPTPLPGTTSSVAIDPAGSPGAGTPRLASGWTAPGVPAEPPTWASALNRFAADQNDHRAEVLGWANHQASSARASWASPKPPSALGDSVDLVRHAQAMAERSARQHAELLRLRERSVELEIKSQILSGMIQRVATAVDRLTQQS